ncbi:MAG TPA: hypothetical protein VF763_02090 [Candidatus Limnocylindrales bacterium]
MSVERPFSEQPAAELTTDTRPPTRSGGASSMLLVSPADAAAQSARRLREAAAAVGWVVRSWGRPAGSEAGWEQGAGGRVGR